MVAEPLFHIDESQSVKKRSTEASEKPVDTMDVPKITVFKSPPWHKPTPQVLPSPKLSDVYEEFPAKSKMFPRRLTMGMSRSLECIPENMILQDTHKYSTSHLRDHNRLSPHQVLPPISRCAEDELPEMRQRAYSDPHKYSVKKRSDERRDISPLKSMTSHSMASKDTPGQRRTNSRESPGSKSPTKQPGTPTSTGSSRQTTSSPLVSKPPRASPLTMNKETKPLVPPIKSRLSGDINNPSSPDSRLVRNKKLVNRNLSSDSIIPHPSVAALKEPRTRTNSLPAGSTNQKTRRRSTNTQPEVTDKGAKMKSSVAYALIGSPGRNRWPSPEREATSYINYSSESSTPNDTPTESLTELDTHQESVSYQSPHHASNEFKSILHELSSPGTNDVATISQSDRYFQRATGLRKPPASHV